MHPRSSSLSTSHLAAASLLLAFGACDVAPNAPRDDAGAPADGGASGTAGALCGLAEQGEQRLVYAQVDPPSGTRTDVDETLAYTYAWTCADGERALSGNGVPDHPVTGGEFATRVSAQTVSFSVPLSPELLDEATAVKEPGYALNSVKFDPATAGTCPGDATDDGDCNYAMGADPWRMVATPGNTSPWKFSFGVDENDAHVQPNGQYHYHGTPVGLVDKRNPDGAAAMTLVGFARDGFPMYALLGHDNAEDLNSNVREMKSSYQTIASPPTGRPSLGAFPLGHFEADWEYVEGSGDLDECNGRFAVTPEYPSGTYHYYTTSTYPFVQRCIKGAAAAETSGPPMGPPTGPPPMP